MKYNLKDYKKLQDNENKLITTSIFITKKQKIFIESKQINFSKLIREFIESLIKEDKKE